MKTAQCIVRDAASVAAACHGLAALEPDLALVFGSVDLLRQDAVTQALRTSLPTAALVGCSTAGEISGEGVDEKTCVVTAVKFDSATCTAVGTDMAGGTDSRAAGERLGDALLASANGQPLAAVLVFGRGTDMNGSALIDGLLARIGQDVPVSGGLAGDDGAFVDTLVVGPTDGTVYGAVAVGLFGDNLSISHGSFGGWQPFGPSRRVTSAEENILHTLDDEPALEVYKRYLGDYAKDLPASGLLFPFEMLGADATSQGLIRTILGVDEKTGSLILAGSVAQGGLLRMMHASTDALVEGAERAAAACGTADGAGLALLVSCVGRKLVMGDRVDEEVEAVADVLGQSMTLTGFYSYGELSPLGNTGVCSLHNQTMTIAVISER